MLYLLVALSGFVSLSWEVIWQIKSSLALGMSAGGTAVTLAVMMGGMCVGGLMMGRLFAHRNLPPFSAYAVLEGVIAFSGLLLTPAFYLLEQIDTLTYQWLPVNISPIQIAGIVLIIGLPAICMGATLPVIGAIADKGGLSKLYGLNTLGAAIGALFVALVLIPWLGVAHAIWVIAGVNLLVGVVAWVARISAPFARNPGSRVETKVHFPGLRAKGALIRATYIVFLTSFATFTLEIAWFRSFASTFTNTTDVFAIMLACLLAALAIAAKRVSRLKQKQNHLGLQLCLAGILILLTTPLIERIDLFLSHGTSGGHAIDAGWLLSNNLLSVNGYATLFYIVRIFILFGLMGLIIIPSVSYLGVAFPWLVDDQQSPRSIGILTAASALGAVMGSLTAAWLFLPAIGFVKTAWLAGVLVVIVGICLLPNRKRVSLAIAGMMAFSFATFYQTHIGSLRVQGPLANIKGLSTQVLASFNGPDETVSAVEYSNGSRALLINSASAAGESANKEKLSSAHYMAWLGHLPMLLHARPNNALVIGFGTGQTANAIRQENPAHIDVVEVNTNVFKLARYFNSNENVLHNSKVSAISMDGRIWLRRTQKQYDVITLEPMPPMMAGVNALYSRQFYLLARGKLTDDGIIAQWLPLHMVAPYYMASMIKTFVDVFPNSILWLDPVSKDGILLGTKDNHLPLGTTWPGFARTILSRNLSPDAIKNSVWLNASALQHVGELGEIINDDNQLLAYGESLYANAGLEKANLWLLKRASGKSKPLFLDTP